MSISQWFSERGEDAFREYELRTLKSLVGIYDNAILAVGGGTPTIPEAAEILRNCTECLYLKASALQLKTILSVLDNSERPLLKGRSVEELLSIRERTYEHTAQYILNLSDYTDGVPSEQDFSDMAIHIRNLLAQ